MNVVYIVGGLGVAVALSSDYVKVNTAIAVPTGIAAGSITYVIQEARSIAGFRRQALTATAAGTAGCGAIVGLVMLVGQGALLIVLLSH